MRVISLPDGRRWLEVDLLAQIAGAQAATVEVTEGKKRWVFTFEGGALVATRSNLKSEQPEAVAEANPQLSGEALAEAIAARRLRNALRSDAAEWAIKPGASASPRERLPTLRLFQVALTDLRDAAQLRAALAPLLSGWPRATGDLGASGLGEPLLGYLQDLDGNRPGEDVLQFAPAEPGLALATLFTLAGAGLLRDERAVVDLPAQAPAPDVPAVRLRESPPERAEAPAPSPYEVTAIPGRARAPAAKHPLEDRLLELRDRFTTAVNHFEAYGLPHDAPSEAFRKVHLELAVALHPDKYIDAPPSLQEVATETFDKERVAWEILGDDAKRAAYIDRVIHGKKTEDELAMEQVQQYWAAENEFKRGVAALNAGRLLQAHQHFQAAVNGVPDELEFRAYFGFTTFQVHRAKDEKAAQAGVVMLKEVLDRNKEQERKLDQGWVLLGRALRDQGNTEGAKRCFVQALRLNPANPDAGRELKRITGVDPTQKKEEPKKEEKKGFFASLFGKK